ncbi:MAG: A/G-specific adenine glycosylase [Anaerolineae bacterium]|nr:A/G-specific adenine glycosylase [Anaerolineae bacterium]
MALADDLLTWYDTQAIALPWRMAGHERMPERAYHVWLSEIMLQQTQVETVKPYYARFLEAYPTIDDLAAAPLGDVLKLWEGLGYYSRARNLHKAAAQVIEHFGGKIPESVSELLSLSGVGRYTAGAVASIAYGMREPALDGNVIRVYSRLFDITDEVSLPATQAKFWELAETLLPEARPGDYNQALMDLGRLICKPRAPRCESCPVQKHCLAYARGVQESRPVKVKKPVTPHYQVTAGLIWNQRGELLIAQRPLKGLLGGLWEFPGGKQETGETLTDCLRRELREELNINVDVGELFTVVKHAFTHFKITLHAFTCRYHEGSGEPEAIGVKDWAWVAPGDLERYAFGKADRQVIAHLLSRDQMLF